MKDSTIVSHCDYGKILYGNNNDDNDDSVGADDCCMVLTLLYFAYFKD